jgi:hypothetical protein
MCNVNPSKNVPDWHYRSIIENGSQQHLLVLRNASRKTETSEAVDSGCIC